MRSEQQQPRFIDMAARYWEKVYHEIMRDRKVGVLPDALKWRFVTCILLAGMEDQGGWLPPLNEMAFETGVSEEQLRLELPVLAKRELIELRVHPSGEERWFVTNYSKRQAAVSARDRKRYERARSASSAALSAFSSQKEEEVAEVAEKQTNVTIRDQNVTDDDIRAALEANGIALNRATIRLLECPWITPEYIAAHVAADPERIGLVIRRMLDGDPAPTDRRAASNRVPPEYEDVVQR